MPHVAHTSSLFLDKFINNRYWVVAEVVASLFALLLILIAVERLLAPWYYTARRRGQPDQMTPLHGGRDSTNEQLTGIISVPDLEEMIRISEERVDSADW